MAIGPSRRLSNPFRLFSFVDHLAARTAAAPLSVPPGFLHYNDPMRAVYLFAALAVGATVSLGIVRGVSLAMSPQAPPVVRTPPAQIVPLPKDVDRLFEEGRESTKAQADALRARVAKNPGDAPARARLMAYSFLSGNDKGLRRLHDEQVVWFAANLPNAPALKAAYADVDNVTNVRTYDLVCDLFELALSKRPKDANVLANYAALVLTSENGRAVALLARAAALEPKNAERFNSLAFAHSLASRGAFGRVDKAEASLAVDAYLEARALGGRVSDKYFLESAYDADRLDVVEREATAMLKAGRDADAVHGAHTVLGRVALKRGDVAAAKTHLLDSAKVEGSPVLGSFGPSMDLARDLLARGERDAVLAYLRATGRFWEDERQVRWTKAVADGGTPDWD